MDSNVELEYVSEKPKKASKMLIGVSGDMNGASIRAIDYAIKKTDAKKIAEISMDGLTDSSYIFQNGMQAMTPAGVMVKDGIVNPRNMKDDVYYSEKDDLIIVKGQFHGDYIDQSHDIAKEIVGMAKDFEIDEIYSIHSLPEKQEVSQQDLTAILSGMPVKQEKKELSDDPSAWFITTDEEMKNKQLSLGLKPLNEGSQMVYQGLDGVILYQAEKKGIKAASVCPESRDITSGFGGMVMLQGQIQDPIAARKGLEVFSKASGVSIDFKDLDLEVEQYKSEVKKTEETLSQLLDQSGGGIPQIPGVTDTVPLSETGQATQEEKKDKGPPEGMFA